jgi:hypothetical protein
MTRLIHSCIFERNGAMAVRCKKRFAPRSSAASAARDDGEL